MTALVLPLFAVLVLVALAVDRWLHAARTRRQILDVLAVVPEVAGVAPPAYGERVGELAEGLARAMGLTEAQAARVAAAARLLRLGEVATRAPVGACTRVAVAAGVRPDVLALLDDALWAPPGGANREAAIVRVATSFEGRLGADRSVWSGALFATVATHDRGEERQAAETLVRFVGNRAAPV